MKRYFSIFVAALAMTLGTQAQEPQKPQEEQKVQENKKAEDPKPEKPKGPEIEFFDAAQFPVYGKATQHTYARYTRLPANYEQITRKDLWSLGLNSTGLYVRFRSNTQNMKIRWESWTGFRMNHMTDTGIRGIDVYTRDAKGNWVFLGCARPSTKLETTSSVISDMDPGMREYMVYLSLYDGVKKLEIGVDKGCIIEKSELNSPKAGKPIVMYGTSILQGGCANRPGMVMTSILSRRLDREVVNLGFSGNARLDPDTAELMASMEDPGIYVLDFTENNTADGVRERLGKFVTILRQAHPDTPIVFVGCCLFNYARFSTKSMESIKAVDAPVIAKYEEMRKAGDKNVYYVDGMILHGKDGEQTIDSAHYTDVGMIRYADAMEPILRKIMRKSKIK